MEVTDSILTPKIFRLSEAIKSKTGSIDIIPLDQMAEAINRIDTEGSSLEKAEVINEGSFSCSAAPLASGTNTVQTWTITLPKPMSSSDYYIELSPGTYYFYTNKKPFLCWGSCFVAKIVSRDSTSFTVQSVHGGNTSVASSNTISFAYKTIR